MKKRETENYKFNQHKTCEFFPCHQGLAPEAFNCLFCYCPLYMLGNACGGDFKETNGYKDCSGCTKPHDAGGYDFIMSKMGQVMAVGSEFVKK